MAGEADIKLEPGSVLVEAPVNVVVAAPDLCVDSPERRKPGASSPQRRALVHDQSDGLTLNWANDYPGGVTMFGVTKITGGPARVGTVVNVDSAMKVAETLRVEKDVVVDNEMKLKTLSFAEGGGKVSGAVQFSDPVAFTGQVVLSAKGGTADPGTTRGRAGVPTVIEIDLLATILELRGQVEELRAKVGLA